MQIKDKFVIDAPQQTVWDFLLDIERMSRCVPGVERVERVDDTTYRGALTVKVGPIATSFGGQAELTEVEAPRRLVASLRGNDNRSGSRVTGTFSSTLTPLSDETTEVAYETDVVIRGRLGQFGQGVMAEVARLLTAQFARCVQQRLQGNNDSETGADGPSIASIVANSVATSVRKRMTGEEKPDEAADASD